MRDKFQEKSFLSTVLSTRRTAENVIMLQLNITIPRIVLVIKRYSSPVFCQQYKNIQKHSKPFILQIINVSIYINKNKTI